jgi:hypothetical protein
MTTGFGAGAQADMAVTVKTIAATFLNPRRIIIPPTKERLSNRIFTTKKSLLR